jgi:HAD superfamily hydrolase (TIGR01509 family)
MTQFCPKAVIFDMDGLLVDSEPVWSDVEDAIFATRNMVLDQEIRRRFIGMRMADFWAGMDDVYHFAEPVPALIEEAVQGMVAKVPDHAHPCVGAQSLLNALKANGVPCAIASSSPMRIIEAVITSKGWQSHFVTHVTGESVPNGKPAPDVFIEAARQLGFAPHECLVLEDSKNGTRAGVASGAVTFAVPDVRHDDPNEFYAITPHVFTDLFAVQHWLEAAGCIAAE